MQMCFNKRLNEELNDYTDESTDCFADLRPAGFFCVLLRDDYVVN